MKVFIKPRLVSTLMGIGILFSPDLASGIEGTIYGVQSRLSSSNFQLFDQITDSSEICNPDSPLFVIAGGVYGAAFKDDTFYGVELENGSGKDFLITIPHSGNALGERVNTNEIGFSNVEGLANVEGQLVAVSIDFPAHTTSLISVDSSTGIGTLIGTGPFNVIIVALAYDPVAGVLYGAGVPFGGAGGVGDPNLYTINPNTGAMSLVGNLGTTIQGMTWSATKGLVGTFEHLYEINTSTGAATQCGATSYNDGMPGSSNGIYALAAIAPSIPDPFKITAISRNTSGHISITWESQIGSSYQVELSPTLLEGTWKPVSGLLPGLANSRSFTHTGATGVDVGFYRVARTVPDF